MSGPVVLAIKASAQVLLGALVDADAHRLIGPPAAALAGGSMEGASALAEQVLQRARRDGIDIRALAFAMSDGASPGVGDRLAAQHGLASLSMPLAHAAISGERLAGAAVGRSSALLLDTDALQAGLLVNGQIYAGATGTAGRIAHLGLDRTGTVACNCGRRGCLAALVAAGDDAPPPPLPAGHEPAPSHRLGWLAVAIIALLNAANPQILILEGALVDAPRDFGWLADTVRLGCLAPTLAGLADVVRAQTDSALLGAAQAAARHLLPSQHAPERVL